jgi:tetratricopeptide (TPR) repeat protein
MVFSLRSMGRHREAAERLETILDWHVPTHSTYWSLGVSWLVAGEPEKALTYFDAMDQAPWENLGRLLALHDLGRNAEFERDFARYRDSSSDNPESIARIYAWTGQKDEAFEWLERMVERKGSEYAGRVKTDLYSKLKEDPRWSAFLERNGASNDVSEQISFQPTYPAAVATALREPKS